MTETNKPLHFKIGTGDTIVHYRFKDGVLYICINPNTTNMKFSNGQSLTKEEIAAYWEQLNKSYATVFEFTDIELGIKFYSGFFLEPSVQVINRMHNVYHQWQLASCA